MPSMTYNSLVNEVMDYLDRTDGDTLTEVPNFINQAQQRMCRECKDIGFEVYVSGTFIVGDSIIAKPSRWRKSIAFRYGSGTGFNTSNQLYLRTYDYIRNFWPDASQTAAPQYYADYSRNYILIGPTPDQAYPYEYSYLEIPATLDVTNQTNWLTNYAPDLLLYATLLEATPYLKNQELVPMWTSYYDRGMASLNNQDGQRKLDRISNRDSD